MKILKQDCSYFLIDRPCKYHKKYNVFCESCKFYKKKHYESGKALGKYESKLNFDKDYTLLSKKALNLKKGKKKNYCNKTGCTGRCPPHNKPA